MLTNQESGDVVSKFTLNCSRRREEAEFHAGLQRPSRYLGGYEEKTASRQWATGRRGRKTGPAGNWILKH
jgi:hypothetical protein